MELRLAEFQKFVRLYSLTASCCLRFLLLVHKMSHHSANRAAEERFDSGPTQLIIANRASELHQTVRCQRLFEV